VFVYGVNDLCPQIASRPIASIDRFVEPLDCNVSRACAVLGNDRPRY